MAALRYCVFDVYGTLLDLDSVIHRVPSAIGDPHAFVRTWRAKQLEYSWTQSLMASYSDFETITEAALDWSLRSRGVDEPRVRAELLATYDELDAYPDAAPTLRTLRARGLRCAVLSNGTSAMLAKILARTDLGPLLDSVISVDDIGIYKPDRRVYAYAMEQLRCTSVELAFQSSNAWDAAGAAAAGLRVNWINRGHHPDEYGLSTSATELHDLAALPASLGESLADDPERPR
jgi:2-haloacid dehalogenase